MLIAVATLAVAAMVTAPTVALTLGRYDAELALRAWPIDAAARARQAARMIMADLSASTLKRADSLSRAALRREPVNVTAARVQGVVAAARGQERATLRWLSYAESLSRRDLAVQTMLIELAVTRGDINGALVHYDRALRTNKAASDVLFPVLFAAASDPRVLPALTQLLSRKPEWWFDYVARWQVQTPPAVPQFKILMATRPDIGVPRERVLAVTAMRQLVAANRVDLAARLHDRLMPVGAPAAGTLVDGDFQADNRLPPFAWDLAGETGLSGAVERRGAARVKALTIDVAEGASGSVAEQLVRLAPGNWRLTYQVGEVSTGGVVPVVSVVCLNGAAPLIEQKTPATPLTSRSLEFHVPADCAAQRIRIGGEAGDNTTAPPPWITAMAVRRIR